MRNWIGLAVTGILCVLMITPLPLAAQGGFEIGITVGQGLYDADGTGAFSFDDCDETGALISNYNVQLGFGAIALDVTFNHTDWPWYDFSSAESPFIQRHGNAVEALVMFRPAEAFELGFTHRGFYTFQPMFGVGLQSSSDAEDDEPVGTTPIYLARGQTGLLIGYGLALDLHPAALQERGVAFRMQLVGKHAFRSEGEFLTPSGSMMLDVDDADWATVSFGVKIRPGA